MTANDEVIFTLPDLKNIYLCPDTNAYDIYHLKSKDKKIIITDYNGRKIGSVESGESATIRVVKPKWWQFISRIFGRNKWEIVNE